MGTALPDAHELLFSYGALQQAPLQLDTFGRVIRSEADILPGFTADYVEIHDARFSDRTGLTVYPHVRRTGDPRDKVVGRVLLLSAEELDAADEFEMSMFHRTRAMLSSHREAWVYLTR